MRPSSQITCYYYVYCERVSVVLDQRANSSCGTGRFELIYRGTTNANSKGCDCKFVVAGQRINKLDLQRYVAIDRKAMRQQERDTSEQRHDDEMTSSTGVCCSQGPTQTSEWSNSVREAGDCQCDGCSSQEHVPSATVATRPHERTADNTARPSSHKTYRGLRQSTVQIYNASR